MQDDAEVYSKERIG